MADRPALPRWTSMHQAALALQTFVAHDGLAALFVLLVVEEAGVWLPLPGDLFVMYFGYRAGRTAHPLLAALPALLTVVAAVCCGSVLLYLLTRRFHSRVRRFGRFIRLDEQQLARMERWVGRHGAWIVIPGRLVPGLRVPTTAVAGLFQLPLRRFLPAVSVAAVLWGALYLTLGAIGHALLAALLHVHTDEPLPDAPQEWLALLALITLLAAGATMLSRRSRSRPR